MLIEDKFEEFWRIYPRRIAKANAKKSWDRAVEKMKLDPEAILKGAERYRRDTAGKEEQYIAHAATWLNQQRWLDEPVEKVELAPAVGSGPNYGRLAATARIAQDTRDRLMERTRQHHWPRVEEAGRRCNVSGIEFWGCLMPELINRAWKAGRSEALGEGVSPAVIEVTREDWLEAKLRVESRARHMRGMQQFGTSISAGNAMRATVNNRRNHADDEGQGMARPKEEGDRGIGCDNPDEWGSGGDLSSVGDQDRPA